ncbi:MAG: hypothetical protein ACLRXC_10420 [[Clostridium] leptum]
MRDFFKSRSFKVLAGVVLVLLGVVLFTAATGRSFLSSLMGFVTTPVQQISARPRARREPWGQWKDHRGAGGGKRRAEGEA